MARRPIRIELPTIAVTVAIYGGWLALTAGFHALPWWLVVPLGGWLLAWHGSLQHEAVHGHPTSRRWLNAVIAGPPLGLWLPFAIYRESHLAHHRTPELTCPLEDPESYYLTAAKWATRSPVRRALHRALQTAGGRLVFGPFAVVARSWTAEAGAVARGRRGRRLVWSTHLCTSAAVLAWVIGVCEIPLWAYLACFVYPGLALTLLRSYAEHRPAEDQSRRTVLVEAGPLLSLLYLNNNLHLIHHRAPHLAWYEIPRRYLADRDALLVENGGFAFRGYGEVLRRYAVTGKDEPVHPGPRSAPITAPATRPSMIIQAADPT